VDNLPRAATRSALIGACARTVPSDGYSVTIVAARTGKLIANDSIRWAGGVVAPELDRHFRYAPFFRHKMSSRRRVTETVTRAYVCVS